MALQVLSFVFKLGKMLALTPSSLTMNPETVISKLYNVLILSLLTGGVFVEISEKNFYSELIFVKKVVCIFGDLIIYILNFYSIIVLGLAKKKSWKDLMENLESTEYLVRIQNRKRDRIWYCLGIGLANLYYFASISYMVYVRYKSMGWRYLNHVQGYLDLYQKLIQWVIIKMVLARYKGLKSLLSAYKQKNQNRQFSTDLKRFEYIMSQLKTTVDVFNELFGWPLLLMIASTIIQVLNTIDFIIFYHNERLEPFDSFLVNTFLVTTALVSGTIVLILACDSVVKEAGAVVTLGYDLRCCLKTAQFLDDLKLKKFTNFLEKNLPKFTAANFFHVGRWTILDLFETLITFLIIMIQFGNSARKQQ